MKHFLTLGLVATLSLPTFAQKHVYEDLLVKFVDEKYEDVLAKAQGYVDNDETKKDPLPYLYISMSLYEMSKIEKFRAMEEYKKCDKDALKWAEKYRKKDKNKEFFDNYADFWSDLNTMAGESGVNFYEEGAKGYSKAKQTFDAMTGYYPENPGPWLMLALCQYNTNLAKEGELSMKSFQTAMTNAGDISALPEDQKKLLKAAMMHYATYKDTKGDKSAGKAILDQGKDAFIADADFKTFYEGY
ncbi:MAG: hypothetical protein IPN85_05710 [Flavobacteriales bacterium]|nr:hypothetical protein [Flavobacteriales bacterium]MBK9287776.1 hypothetical protein [Flavobacteriales bacterium]MBL0035499.1 hypothetical protein [Flavobacteriales bacterium]